MVGLVDPPEPDLLSILELVKHSLQILGKLEFRDFSSREMQQFHLQSFPFRQTIFCSLIELLDFQMHLLDSSLEIEDCMIDGLAFFGEEHRVFYSLRDGREVYEIR